MSLGVLVEYAKSHFASSPCTHKSFPRILRICLDTFRAFSNYAERMKNTQKEIFTFNYAWGL